MESRKGKARFVILGHMDPDLHAKTACSRGPRGITGYWVLSLRQNFVLNWTWKQTETCGLLKFTCGLLNVRWTKRNPAGIAISGQSFGSLPTLLPAGETGTSSWSYRNAFLMIGHVVRMKRLNIVWIIFEANFNFAPNDRRTSLSLEYTSRKTETAKFTWIKLVMSLPSIPFMLRARANNMNTRKWLQRNFKACEESFGSFQYAANTIPARLLAMQNTIWVFFFNFQYWCW